MAMNRNNALHETTGATRRVKLLVIEDSYIVRKRLCALIEQLAVVDLVGCAEDGNQGLVLFRALQPEAVVLDLQLPGVSGFDLLPILKRERPNCVVMVLTTYTDDAFRQLCVRLGADYFFSKFNEFERVLDVLEQMSSAKRPTAAESVCSNCSDAQESARQQSQPQHRILDTGPGEPGRSAF
jgi:DNA-binding NarL/FixJ family response regulator